jgi:hypothetical protein
MTMADPNSLGGRYQQTLPQQQQEFLPDAPGMSLLEYAKPAHHTRQLEADYYIQDGINQRNRLNPQQPQQRNLSPAEQQQALQNRQQALTLGGGQQNLNGPQSFNQQQPPTLPPQIGQQKFGWGGFGSLGGGGGQTNVSLNLQGSATMNPQGASQNRGYTGFDFNPAFGSAQSSGGMMQFAEGGSVPAQQVTQFQPTFSTAPQGIGSIQQAPNTPAMESSPTDYNQSPQYAPTQQYSAPAANPMTAGLGSYMEGLQYKAPVAPTPPPINTGATGLGGGAWFEKNFYDLLRENKTGDISQDKLDEAIKKSSWYGKVNNGSGNPYTAAREVLGLVGQDIRGNFNPPASAGDPDAARQAYMDRQEAFWGRGAEGKTPSPASPITGTTSYDPTTQTYGGTASDTSAPAQYPDMPRGLTYVGGEQTYYDGEGTLRTAPPRFKDASGANVFYDPAVAFSAGYGTPEGDVPDTQARAARYYYETGDDEAGYTQRIYNPNKAGGHIRSYAQGGSIPQGIASLGRGQDSMLVHMTPGEVQGLQKLAMAHGGSLTINPQTGLPEAGILSSHVAYGCWVCFAASRIWH